MTNSLPTRRSSELAVLCAAEFRKIVMIIETTEDDYAAMLRGAGPRWLLWPDPPVAPPEILAMLADVAAGVRVHFAPASWLIVAEGAFVRSSGERRVGEVCVRTGSYRLSPDH